jgi:hypothetical protein
VTDIGIAICNAFASADCLAGNAFQAIELSFTRPCVVFRPRFGLDGDQYFFLLGSDLQDGVCGFGKTPADAARAFDRAWLGLPTEEAGE